MAVVDDVTMPPITVAAAPAHSQDRALADEAFQSVIVDPHSQPEANQARRHGIEHFAQNEAAAGGHEYRGLIVVSGSGWRQRAQGGAFQLHHLAAAGVAAADEVGDPGTIGVESVEIGAIAQQQGLRDTALEVTVLALDRAVLMCDPGVVARRRHFVMRAQRLVATGLVGAGIVVEVAKGGGEAVGAVLGRHAAERPECVLQADGECGEAFAAEYGLGMLPGRVGQGEMIQPVVEWLAGDADAEIAHVGEVGEPLLSGDVVLAEDDLTVSAVLGPPGADPALQTTAQPVPVVLGAATLHLLEQGDRPQARLGLEHRADLGVPEPGEGIRCRAWPRIGGLRWRPAIRLDAAGSTLAEAGLGRSNALGMVVAKLHEYSHLLACDVSSGHFGPRLGRRGTDLARTRRGPQTRAQARVTGRAGLRLGHTHPPASPTGHLLVSLTGHLSCRARTSTLEVTGHGPVSSWKPSQRRARAS